MFAKMAGVRGDKDNAPISKPRGLPKNLSAVTKMDAKHWGIDAHSASWLSDAEAQSVQDWYESLNKDYHHPPLFGYLFGNHIGSYIKYPEDGESINRNHLSMASPDAKTIKLADIIDNLPSIVAHDPEFGRVYLKEKELAMPLLTEGDPVLQERVTQIIMASRLMLYGTA